MAFHVCVYGGREVVLCLSRTVFELTLRYMYYICIIVQYLKVHAPVFFLKNTNLECVIEHTRNEKLHPLLPFYSLHFSENV